MYGSLDLSSVRRSFHYLFQYELLYNSTADHLSGSNLKDILEKRRHLLFIMLWVAIPGNEIFLMSQLSVRQSDPTGIGFPTKPDSVGYFRCCPLRSLWLWGQVSEGECRDTAYLSVLYLSYQSFAWSIHLCVWLKWCPTGGGSSLGLSRWR